MRSKLFTAVAIAVMAFLLATNPAVGQAAAKITGKQIKDGSVTGNDIRDGSLSVKDISGSLAGPQGPVGPAGPQGVAGTPAAALWAVVKTVGTSASIVRGSGAVGVTEVSPGNYRVAFNRSIVGCGYVATAGDVGDDSAAGLYATVEQANAAAFPDQVQVRTRSDTGAVTESNDLDDGFHVAVFC